MLHRRLTPRHCQITLAVCLVCCTVLPSVQASTIGMVDGLAHSGEPFKGLKLDLSALATSDVSRGGLRLTLTPLADDFVLFVDAVVVDGERRNLAINGDVDYSGRGGGVGLFYTGLSDWMSMTRTLRLSAHRETSEVDTALSVSGREATVKNELNSQALRILFSPRKPLHDNGLNAYVSLGLSHDRESRKLRLDNVPDTRLSDRDSRINGTIETGIVYPWQRFRLYAVAGYHDEFSMTLGLRYHIGRSPKTPW